MFPRLNFRALFNHFICEINSSCVKVISFSCCLETVMNSYIIFLRIIILIYREHLLHENYYVYCVFSVNSKHDILHLFLWEGRGTQILFF